jgi:hypothetical protein
LPESIAENAKAGKPISANGFPRSRRREDRLLQGTYPVLRTLLWQALGVAMSTISERLSNLSTRGNLSDVDKELVHILQQVDQRLRKLESGASSTDPIESELGMTAPQSR